MAEGITARVGYTQVFQTEDQHMQGPGQEHGYMESRTCLLWRRQRGTVSKGLRKNFGIHPNTTGFEQRVTSNHRPTSSKGHFQPPFDTETPNMEQVCFGYRPGPG